MLVVTPATGRCLVGNLDGDLHLFLASTLLLLVQDLPILQLLLQTHSLHLFVLVPYLLSLAQEVLLQLYFVAQDVLASHLVLLHLGFQDVFVAILKVALLLRLLLRQLLGKLVPPQLPFFVGLGLLVPL